MIIDFNICVAEENKIIITDLTKENKLYLLEDSEVERYYNFKYSQTVTINIIELVTLKEISLIDILYTDHCVELDEVHYKLPKDGYYRITHVILPTLEWLELTSNKDYYDMIYVSDGLNLYKYFNNKLVPCTHTELIERNCTGTTISRADTEMFFMYNLKKCYVEISKNLLKASLSKCAVKDKDDAVFKKDFLWMAINVIRYYVELDLLYEAERLLEEINYCNGFCNTTDLKISSSGCGCSKA